MLQNERQGEREIKEHILKLGYHEILQEKHVCLQIRIYFVARLVQTLNRFRVFFFNIEGNQPSGSIPFASQTFHCCAICATWKNMFISSMDLNFIQKCN